MTLVSLSALSMNGSSHAESFQHIDVPDEFRESHEPHAAQREKIAELRLLLKQDQDFKELFLQDPEEALAEIGISGDLRREILLEESFNSGDFSRASLMDCTCTSCCATCACTSCCNTSS